MAESIKRTLITILLLLLAPIIASAQGQQQARPSQLSLPLPGKAWAVEIDAPGFTLQVNEIRQDGRKYVLAQNDTTGLVLSVTLEQVRQAANNEECRRSLSNRVKAGAALHVTDVRSSEIGSVATAEYTIPGTGGIPLQQKNVFACLAKDDVYVDIHLSKAQFRPNQEELFTSLLKTVRIVDQEVAAASGKSPDSMEYMREGSKYYLQHRYREAIGPYEKALDLEKKNPALDKNLWLVLIDNLGMSYGITGDLHNAEETFRYGLTKDPEYPMFSYNLACTYGERNDLERVLTYLKTAFQYKENVIPGETMPGPAHGFFFRALFKK